MGARSNHRGLSSIESLDAPFRALIVGAGGIASALRDELEADPNCARVVMLSRSAGFDLLDESSIIATLAPFAVEPPDLVVVATGILAPSGAEPEKSLRALDPETMAAVIAVNAIGPALVLKHVLPLLSRRRRAIVAALSARVGSIEDNHLGGWVSYRTSKAALNQIVRTAAIEFARTHPEAVLLALHPGTVATRFSARYAERRERIEARDAARRLLKVLDAQGAERSGSFLAYDGSTVPW